MLVFVLSSAQKDCFIERDALLADSQMGFSIGLLFYSCYIMLSFSLPPSLLILLAGSTLVHLQVTDP